MQQRFKFSSFSELEIRIAQFFLDIDAEKLVAEDKIREEQINRINDFVIPLKYMTTAVKDVVDSENAVSVSELDNQLEKLNEQNEKLTKLQTEQLIEEKIAIQKDLERKIALQLRLLTDEQRSKALTGMFLSIGEEIEKQFSGWMDYLNGALGKDRFYRGIPAVIGESNDNKLDPASKKEALQVYRQLYAVVKQIPTYDKSKLKHVETSEKQARLVTEDSISPRQLFASYPYKSEIIPPQTPTEGVTIGTYARMQQLLKIDLLEYDSRKPELLVSDTEERLVFDKKAGIPIPKVFEQPSYDDMGYFGEWVDHNKKRLKVVGKFDKDLAPVIDKLRNDDNVVTIANLRKVEAELAEAEQDIVDAPEEEHTTSFRM